MQAAIQRLRNRKDEEQGFTLIELMVVVLIIAILIAFAIPTFLGARRRAQDRSAQSTDRNAITAAKTVFSDTEDYLLVTNAELSSAEPAITFEATSATPSAGPKSASVDQVSATEIVFAVESKSGACFAARDVIDPSGTTATQFSKVSNVASGACTADAAQVAANVNWADQF
ncbi:MAG: type II secretion system GspH family protein [Acidimicrobiia bacterium]|nr:type II secretion system GspH family protein [Acidimicrobiia bacterium]